MMNRMTVSFTTAASTVCILVCSNVWAQQPYSNAWAPEQPFSSLLAADIRPESGGDQLPLRRPEGRPLTDFHPVSGRSQLSPWEVQAAAPYSRPAASETQRLSALPRPRDRSDAESVRRPQSYWKEPALAPDTQSTNGLVKLVAVTDGAQPPFLEKPIVAPDGPPVGAPTQPSASSVPALQSSSNETAATPGFVSAADPIQQPPPTPGSAGPSPSLVRDLEILKQRMEEVEQTRIAHEDATRTIIRNSFSGRGSNINEYVVFGGTLETLAGWTRDFDGVSDSAITLDTAQIDFEIQMNPWALGSVIFEYVDGTDVLFPTTQGDEVFVDRLNVDTAYLVLGDVQKCPFYAVAGRMIVPFGISTGNPIADVLTIESPLTLEVFETREAALMLGFAVPTPPPPPAPTATPLPGPPPVRPVVINPFLRGLNSRLSPYFGCYGPPKAAAPPTAASLAPVPPPLSGAIFVFKGDTTNGGEDHIEHFGGTLGYRKQGRWPSVRVPWSIDMDVDVNNSVFDSQFLQFQYRSFLDQIGFVPGMAAHVKSTLGPFLCVAEWNGAINNANFLDDLGTPINIAPSAWQIQLAYQFAWNPSAEIIGEQGSYFVIGYSESDDLAGVTRVTSGVPKRVGFVPRSRFLVGFGEWFLDGCRLSIEYSHIVDYSIAEGGTGNTGHGVFAQMSYQW